MDIVKYAKSESRFVSVIIPSYNRAHYISEAIESVLDQDVKDCRIEILVVDDGSTDNTSEIVSKFGSSVRYFYQTNKGAGTARNRGVLEARGDWIAFLDSDDRWLPHKLSLQFKILEAFPDYQAIHSEFRIFNDTGIITETGLQYWVENDLKSEDIKWDNIYSKKYRSEAYGIYFRDISFDIYTGNLFRAELKTNCVSVWTLLVRKKCLTQDIFFSESYPTWEDYWFTCRLSEKFNVIFMNVATAENRGHQGPRLTQVDYIDKLKCHIDICNKIYISSNSINKPPESEIDRQYKRLHIKLFKEYLKKGRRMDAKKTYEGIKIINSQNSDITLLFYRFASLLPFNVIRFLLSLKKTIQKMVGPIYV